MPEDSPAGAEPPGSTSSGAIPLATYVVVSYDLDTTGRRLTDEICHIGCFYNSQTSEECEYTQYVMPHRNPNEAARRAFGIRVVNIGRSRMLKDLNTGEILKTKSEISALQGFLSWLEKAKGSSDGVILVSHEQDKRVLVPLLLQSLEKYDLISSFSNIVKGFCNSANVISELGNKEEITSLSLRSLCKTVLHNTSLPTTSAVDRCKRVLEILNRVTGAVGAESNEGGVKPSGDGVNPSRDGVKPSGDGAKPSWDGAKPSGEKGEPTGILQLVGFSVSVEEERENLRKLQKVETIQNTLRPIFVTLMSESWQVRERMLRLRRAVAEQGVDYRNLQEYSRKGELEQAVSKVSLEPEEKEELINLINQHFKVEAGGKRGLEAGPQPVSPSEAVDAVAVKIEAVKLSKK